MSDNENQPHENAPQKEWVAPKEISITLVNETWNIILDVLGDLPAKKSMGIIQSIQFQAQQQLTPPKGE